MQISGKVPFLIWKTLHNRAIYVYEAMYHLCLLPNKSEQTTTAYSTS